jgi:hypothetical protein
MRLLLLMRFVGGGVCVDACVDVCDRTDVEDVGINADVDADADGMDARRTLLFGVDGLL